MSATAMKKAGSTLAYPAATSLFENIVGVFALPSKKASPKVEQKQLTDWVRQLEAAPLDEVDAVKQLLAEVSERVARIGNAESVQARRAEEYEAEQESARVRRILADTRPHTVETALTAEAQQANAAVMAELRQGSAIALQQRIDNKLLLPPKEFQAALGISRQAINEAMKAKRMFALLGPGGEYYYPAFFADKDLHRRDIEKVSKALGNIPPPSKYFFFTNVSASLGALSPLDALLKGKVDEVMEAAAAFAES